MYPNDLKYTKTHEWAKVEGNKITVGITDFAATQINEIIYVELPKVGKEVTQGASFASIESVKAVFDIYSPVSGKVVQVNEAVVNNPQEISKDPYKGGWLAVIELSNQQDISKLMDPVSYEKHTLAEHAH